MFEIINRDAAGRLGKLFVGNREIKTPNIAIVVSPTRQIVPVKVMKKMGAELIITNSYIIRKNSSVKKEVSKKGLHKYFGWNGPIYTDSGTFQMYSQNVSDLDNKKIIRFQKKIGSDIITPVDIFTLPNESKETAAKKLVETISRIMEAKKLTSGNFVAPIQGGRYIELRKTACKKLSKVEPLIYAVGGIVPYMEQYRFSKVAEILITCKLNLPPHIPIHVFGAGHPMMFSFLVALGCDLFDSAMYSLAAQRGAYLTTSGTMEASNIKEFPCTCPVCSNCSADEFKKMSLYQKEKFLTLHNLYVTLGEIKNIRESIRQERLWELVQQRARAHPKLLDAFRTTLKRYGKHLVEFEKISKHSALFYSGEETRNRPEVLSALMKIKNCTGKKVSHKFWGKLPVGLKDTYPFSQSVVPGSMKCPSISPSVQLRAIIDYQFGKKASKKFKGIKVEVSKKTGRLRRVWKGKKLLGTIRPNDGMFIPTFEGANLLGRYIKEVVIRDREAAGFVCAGKSLFAKFAYPQKGIRPGEEVVVRYKKKTIALGTAILNSYEMKHFVRGVAVKIRRRQKVFDSLPNCSFD